MLIIVIIIIIIIIIIIRYMSVGVVIKLTGIKTMNFDSIISKHSGFSSLLHTDLH